MDPNTGEVLVWLDVDRATDALAVLSEIGQVTQVLPPRLALVAASGDELTRVSAIPWTKGLFERGDEVVIPDLSASEELFIQAWEQRARRKARPGDALDWDAPGYSPPDPPPCAGGPSHR